MYNNQKKVIARIRGGLGNQLFCYAAARRLALFNNAELVIDDITGFLRDTKYRRHYELDRFHISARKAAPYERMEPFERYRRGIAKVIARKKPFSERKYIEENGTGFDCRLLNLEIKQSVYLDGLWQDERYFSDIEDIIRKDFTFIEPVDSENKSIAELIKKHENPVSIHIRWFEKPQSKSDAIPFYQYYVKAIEHIKSKIQSPCFFVFSDYIEHLADLTEKLDKYILVNINNNRENMAYADMWLMSLCRHHIYANSIFSSFSWWGAWLGKKQNRISTNIYSLV